MSVYYYFLLFVLNLPFAICSLRDCLFFPLPRRSFIRFKFSNNLVLHILFFYVIGNDNLFALTRTNRIMSLYLQKWDGSERTANYSNFYINDENENYRLTVSNFTIRKCCFNRMCMMAEWCLHQEHDEDLHPGYKIQILSLCLCSSFDYLHP